MINPRFALLATLSSRSAPPPAFCDRSMASRLRLSCIRCISSNRSARTSSRSISGSSSNLCTSSVRYDRIAAEDTMPLAVILVLILSLQWVRICLFIFIFTLRTRTTALVRYVSPVLCEPCPYACPLEPTPAVYAYCSVFLPACAYVFSH
jgi:hypothetical protein